VDPIPSLDEHETNIATTVLVSLEWQSASLLSMAAPSLQWTVPQGARFPNLHPWLSGCSSGRWKNAVVVWNSADGHKNRPAMICSDILKRKTKKLFEFIPILEKEALDYFEALAVLPMASFIPILFLTFL
jgi:hypothetical protein